MWKLSVGGTLLAIKGVPVEFKTTKELREAATASSYYHWAVELKIIGDHLCSEYIRCDECEWYYGSCLHEEGRKDDIKF